MTSVARVALLLTLVSALLSPLAGCRADDASEGGETEQAETGGSDGDLPCGGADLLTDDQNCGACGHVCPLSMAGTQWEAGGCQDGVCGPSWSSCGASWQTCNEYCSAGGTLQCVDGGCAGASGLRINVPGLDACEPDGHVNSPIATCDTIIDYQSDDPLFVIESVCCCAPTDG